MTPQDEIAHLRATGWTFVDRMWMDPRKDATYHQRMGGYSNPDTAYRIQRDYERWDAGLPTYAVCAARDGYGYLLRKCAGPKQPYVTVYRHHDEKRLKQTAAEWNALGSLLLLDACETTLKSGYDDHTYPYLLLCEEKHGAYRFHVPTREAFHKACLSVVERRNADGYWYVYEDASELTPPALTEEQVAALKDGRIKDAALAEWKQHKVALKRLDAEKEERALLAKALKGDGEAAAEFLRARKDGEYEGFEVVELDQP